MNRKIALGLHGLMLLGIAAFTQAAAPAMSTAEKAVAALEDKWTESQSTNNPDLIAPSLADKFVYTGSDGSFSDKTKYLVEAKSTKWNSVAYTNDKFTAFGTTVIVTGEANGKGIDSTGKPMTYHDRYTDVWVKMPNGKWQCVSSQSSPIA